VPSRRTGIVVIAVMLAASGLAFLRAEQLKLERSPIGGTHVKKFFSTTCQPLHPHTRCASHSALMSFRLRKPDRVALAIVNSSGATVDQLTPAVGQRRPRGRVTVHWNGRTGSGAQAAEGDYHLRVHLISLGRTITIPDSTQLDLTPPTVTLESTPGSHVIRYSTTEPAILLVRATGTGANAGHSALFRGHGGRVHFRRTKLAGADVTVTLVAVDRAGNRSAPVSAGSFRLPA
jgi:flagellar hook capping protein FlgD